MKHLFAAPAIILLLSACNNNSTESTKAPVAAEEQIAIEHSCYVYTSTKDTVHLHLQISGNMVTGDFSYNYFEKDKNSGTLQGNMKGDTLFAVYKFMSEGTESVREVAFLKKGNDFVEGYGAVEDVNKGMIFTNRSALDFPATSILKKVECNMK